MSWVAAAVVGTGVAGAVIGADASRGAARAQQQSAEASIGEQRRQFDITQANAAPFLQTGTAANARLRALLGLDSGDPTTSPLLRRFTAADLETDPVYQSGLKFGLDEGRTAINARAIRSGGYDSGATLKALTRFGTDYGATKSGESYNRFRTDQGDIYNKLAGISGTGQVATNQVASAGSAAAGSIGASLADIGNARAAGIVGGANAWGGALGSVGGGVQTYQNNQLLQKILGRGATPNFDYTGYDAYGGPAYG
jgi:hypothetical protein